MTVAEMLDRMSGREFREWMAYSSIEPFGEERADLRQAMTTSAVHNSVQAQTKHPKYTKPADFMPFVDKPESAPAKREPVSPEELRAKFMAFTSKRG